MFQAMNQGWTNASKPCDIKINSTPKIQLN